MDKLLSACKNNDIEAFLFILGKGGTININYIDENGYTALIWATYTNNPEIVKLLLRNGADMTHTNKDDKTALQYAPAGKFENIKNIMTLYSVLRNILTITYLQVIPRDIILVIESFL